MRLTRISSQWWTWQTVCERLSCSAEMALPRHAGQTMDHASDPRPLHVSSRPGPGEPWPLARPTGPSQSLLELDRPRLEYSSSKRERGGMDRLGDLTSRTFRC